MLILGKITKIDEFPTIEMMTETGPFKVTLDSYILKPRTNDIVYVELTSSPDGQTLLARITLNVSMEKGTNSDYDICIRPHNGDVMILINNHDKKTIEITNGNTSIVLEDNEPLSINVAGISLFDVLDDLIKNTKGIITEGSPATQKVSQASQLLLDTVKNKLSKVLK